MTSAKLEMITERIARLHGYAYFRPQEGALTERLKQSVLDGVDEELAEELSEGEYGLEVSIGRQEGDDEYTLNFRVDRPGVAYRSHLALEALNDDEVDDLARYLEPVAESAPAEAEVPITPNATIRRTSDTTGHHEKETAAARLKVTPEWLKSVVPCTEYSYEEIDGKKYIRDYYWSKELIERLFKIKCSKTTPEDLEYVAKECCEGDMEWARDLIARLKSPNRPEPAPKEQQKGQGRVPQQQGRGAQQKGPQVRPAGNKPAPANPPAKQQPQAKPAPQATAAPGTAAAPTAAPAGAPRERSRRRHRKPFRQQGKDAPQKPDNPSTPRPS